MHRIDSGSAGPGNSFVNGTVISPEFAQAVQEEISGVIEGVSDVLDKPDNTQLFQAIAMLISNATSPLQAQIDALETFANSKGVRSTTINNNSFPDDVLTAVNWGPPDYDDLGFYNAGADRMVIPNGITRIDVSFHFKCTLPADDRVTIELFRNGTRLGVNGNDTGNGQGGREGGSIAAVGVNVSQGDFIEAFVRPEGASISSNFSGHISVQARRINV